MITINYCTREYNEEYEKHLIKTCGLKNVKINPYINNGEGLTKPYNELLDKSDTDIVVFCHDDLVFKTNNWGNKLLKHFKKNSELGIIGIAGTKHLTKSGRWWDSKKDMRGIVEHEKDGKSWVSKYSDDIGNKIDDVVLVDGLFFAIDKTKIKERFNEEIKGYHFYDVDFSFRNKLKNVNVGVITNIRVLHKSIGETNREWEDNRILFSEKYKNDLPFRIKEDFKNRKMKVLLSCLNFNGYTGSELYVFELAKELIKNNCEVSICSNIGNPLANIANILGIKLYNLNEPPHFKLGDGKWGFNTPEGQQLSKEGVLYSHTTPDFDIIHTNHTPITEHILKLYHGIPIITTIHSEVIALENPIVDDRISKYITIRPEISEHIINNFDVPEEKIRVIYNPIDYKRFNENNNKLKNTNTTLFVGTLDYLRRETLLDLIKYTHNEKRKLLIVGKENGITFKDLISDMSLTDITTDHVRYEGPTPNVEKYLKQCDETAGILLGRTTIEGWLSGKKAWIYDVDDTGQIKTKTLHDIPEDIDKFKSDNVVKEIINVYKEIMN